LQYSKETSGARSHPNDKYALPFVRAMGLGLVAVRALALPQLVFTPPESESESMIHSSSFKFNAIAGRSDSESGLRLLQLEA
jgi:hypothetical protein